MNERFEQLAEEAGFMDSWFSESGDDCERELKRFAELLVKECAKMTDDYVAMKVDAAMLGSLMLQTFGVKNEQG